MTDRIRIALLDDDEAVLDSLRLYLRRRRIEVDCFTSADAFMAERHRHAVDCIVADVRMPGMSGLDLVRRLAGERSEIPIILITGHGDVEMAVAALKLGATDFIEKPFDEARLLESIRAATGGRRARLDAAAELAKLRTRFDGLSERQQQVMRLAVAGLSNKEIATRLGISPRTVEIHRAWVMERMATKNLAELVRIGMQLELSGMPVVQPR